MKYKLSIVTVTYNVNIAELEKCINSIITYNDLDDPIKIIIVDNSPEENQIPDLFKKKYPDIEFINNKNTGFGTANNIGAKATNSDYILFFNNDTELTEPIFKKIINTFNLNKEIGCIGINQKGGQPSFFQRNESTLSYIKAKYQIYKGNYNSDNFFISGAFMFFKRKAFEECGEFDPNIFLYNEEADISNRLLKCGYIIHYIKEISFLHKAGNRSSLDSFTYKESAQSLLYYIHKYNLQEKKIRILHKFIRLWTLKKLVFILKFDFKSAKRINKGINIYKKTLI